MDFMRFSVIRLRVFNEIADGKDLLRGFESCLKLGFLGVIISIYWLRYTCLSASN